MNNEYYSVSRIENSVAVLEFPDGSFGEISCSLLPDGVKEGNILTKNSSGEFVFDFDEEKRRKDKFLSLQKKIFK